jgi:hypothetical protein
MMNEKEISSLDDKIDVHKDNHPLPLCPDGSDQPGVS